MQTVSRSSFTTITTEGAILPADLLQRIVDGRELAGLRPEDYHLAPNERLNEAISRSWNRLLGVWEGFDEQRKNLPVGDRGTTLTRERWLLILLQELGYGRLPYIGSLSLENEDSFSEAEADQASARYPISHEYDRAPLHLITFRQPLDRADNERAERFRRSPHSLLQEFLNRSDRHLWGIVSNGLRLRLMRDNVSFTRAAYLEFDLEAMMEGEIYADFTLLWLAVHQSRVEGAPETCWLEKWSQEAAEQGTRALDSLRDGVQEAISILGRGFLAHPANGALRQQLQSGDLGTQDYYRQLLRLVYRLIFLFVAEDRNLLLVKEADAGTREQYYSYYSLTRLRELAARRRSGPHPDLYRSLRLVMVLLREGYPPLGLPGLGSYLFSERSTHGLDEAEIANEALLDAIRALAFTVENRVLRLVDYKNLGAEELGSVYESLLELHPELNVAAATFELKTAAGSERKTTGSYYTPTSLINSLLDTALEPVVTDRLRSKRGKEAEEALLAIKVVDPAAGSGHFLIAAANRLARHLARIRTGDEEPSPEANRLALRDVVGRCIHGVDINEMAVELCKVGLWLETLDPSKPLSFLEKNILHGNSLIGVGPGMKIKGVPYEAFEQATGDHRPTVMGLRARNRREQGSSKEEIAGQFGLRWEVTVIETAQDLERWRDKQLERLNAMPEDEVRQLRKKQDAYETYLGSNEYQQSKLEYDLWTSSFFWPVSECDSETMLAPTHQELATFQAGQPLDVELRRRVEELAGEHKFFHWELAFSSVFSGDEPGFDVVLGNPPWERVKLEANEWFASRSGPVVDAPNASERKKEIRKLEQTNPSLYAEFVGAKWTAEKESLFIRNSNRFPLAGRGDVNTYQVFAELSRSVLNGRGHAGIVVFTGIATDYTTRYFFQDIIQHKAVVSLYSFWEIRKFFAGTDTSLPFCLLTLSGGKWQIDEAQYAFDLKGVEELTQAEKTFSLSAEDIALINPNSLTCPIFKTRWDAEVTKKMYRRIPVLVKNGPPEKNPWDIRFLTMFHMSNDSQLFRTREQLEAENWDLSRRIFHRSGERYLPLYEGKMADAYNHRFASAVAKFGKAFRKSGSEEHREKEWKNCEFHNLPLYWVPEPSVAEVTHNYQVEAWLIYKRVTRAAIERTFKSCIVPYPNCGLGDKVPALVGIDGNQSLLLQGNFNSFVFDYAARQKVGNVNLAQFILEQLPVLPPEKYGEMVPWASHLQLLTWIKRRVVELTYNSHDLQSFANAIAYYGPPFRWEEYRRFILRSELDAAYFHLYGLSRDDTGFILSNFPLVERKEEKEFSEYRTKRVILEIYDEMAEAMASGQTYQTRLDPPPAHPDAAHPWDEEYLGPELPKDQWWREIEVPEPVESDKPRTAFTSSAAKVAVKEPSPAFELKSPPSKENKKKQARLSSTSQQPIIDVLPAPTGSRSTRLMRAMALGKDQSPLATLELVAFLADEDSSIRWLAASSLVQRASLDVVSAIAAFLDKAEPERVRRARPEAERVLGLIADTAGDEDVRVQARVTINSRR